MVFFACSVLCRNYAILFNGSCNFYNYRHTSNIMTLAHVLLTRGFSQDDIVAFSGENAMHDARNIHKQHVYLSDRERIPLPSISVEESTVQSFLNAVACNHPKLFDCDKSSNVLVYICGHGNDGFLKVQYREAILSGDLHRAVQKLARRAKKVLLVVDTCKSESFISKYKYPKNVFAVATSLISEPSISSFIHSELGVHCVDNFAYYFHEVTANLANVPLKKFFDMFDRASILSTIKCAFSPSVPFHFDDFFAQSSSKEALVPL